MDSKAPEAGAWILAGLKSWAPLTARLLRSNCEVAAAISAFTAGLKVYRRGPLAGAAACCPAGAGCKAAWASPGADAGGPAEAAGKAVAEVLWATLSR